MIYYILTLVTGTIFAAFNAIQPIFLQNALDSISEGNEKHTMFLFVLFVLAILGVITFEGAHKLVINKYDVEKKRILKKGL